MATPKKTKPADDTSTPDINLEDSAPPSAAVIAPRWGMGHLPDPPDPRDRNLGQLLGATAALPTESDLSRLVQQVYDQGNTSSCVAQATIGAVEARMVFEGRPARLSRRAAYDLARALDRASPTDPLVDGGSYPRQLFRALRDVGVPTEDKVPFSVSAINDELKWDDLQDASRHRIAAWYRVDVVGDSRLAQVVQALALNRPVVFGTAVGSDFMDAGSSTVLEPEPDATVLGGHMLGIYGHRTSASGELEFLIRNSYGTSWARGGFAWARASFVRDVRATDFYVVTL